MNCCCIRCKSILKDTDNKTCEICIAYIGQCFVCSNCSIVYTRTNGDRHMRSFRCISENGEFALYYN